MYVRTYLMLRQIPALHYVRLSQSVFDLWAGMGKCIVSSSKGEEESAQSYIRLPLEGCINLHDLPKRQ